MESDAHVVMCVTASAGQRYHCGHAAHGLHCRSDWPQVGLHAHSRLHVCGWHHADSLKRHHHPGLGHNVCCVPGAISITSITFTKLVVAAVAEGRTWGMIVAVL